MAISMVIKAVGIVRDKDGFVVTRNDRPSWFEACSKRAQVFDRTGYWCNRAVHAIENGQDLKVTAEDFEQVKQLLGGWVYGPPYNGAMEHYEALKIVVEVPLTILKRNVLADGLDTLAVGRKLSVRT